ncbi:SDR family oxidoreductase [Paenibacillus yanchengensis]|uniref:SDR family oxidoreductase n=1 Tax=Paenibacillus yanchengensis TaxID=2035833 RepID=A0ABW4YF65_9BACL
MDKKEMEGKYCIVTGANSGIGKETAIGLAKAGAYVVFTARDKKRGEEARAEIVKRSGNEHVELLVADLSTHAGVQSLATQYLQKHDQLHVLVNNVGGLFQTFEKNKDGMELTFALNYYAPFLLTHLLLDTMKKSAPARIINVASRVQAESLHIGKLLHPAPYKSMQVYGTSKLAVIMFTYTIAEKLQGTGVTVNAVHPGVIFTPQSARVAPTFFSPLLKLFMSSPEKGAQPSLRLAMEPTLQTVSGNYYNQFTPKRTVPFSYDKQEQEKLYEWSLALVGKYS